LFISEAVLVHVNAVSLLEPINKGDSKKMNHPATHMCVACIKLL